MCTSAPARHGPSRGTLTEISSASPEATRSSVAKSRPSREAPTSLPQSVRRRPGPWASGSTTSRLCAITRGDGWVVQRDILETSVHVPSPSVPRRNLCLERRKPATRSAAALDQLHAVAVRVAHERQPAAALAHPVRLPLGLDALHQELLERPVEVPHTDRDVPVA